MNDTKYLLKIWSVICVVAAVFVIFSSLPHALAAICVTCGDGGGGGGTVTVPIAPTLNSVNQGSSGQVSVNFTDNSSDEAGFYVYRGATLVGTLAAITGTGTVSVYTDTGMTCGATYSYYVQAYNSAGGANSATLSVAVKCPPTAPTINSYGALSQTSASVTWTTTSAIDFSYTFKDSLLYGSAPQADAGGTQYTSIFTGLACGSTHTYFVRVGNGPNTADSPTISITTQPCVSAPAPVTSPLATPVPGNPSISSSWTGTFDGVRVYLKGPTGYSLAGDFVSAIKATSFAGLKCPYPYTAYYLAYNNDSSVSGTDVSCSSALSNAGISGPAAPTGAKCAAIAAKAVDMRFCTQQFLGN